MSPVPPRPILIVDDEPDLVSLVEFNLRQAGFETVVASSGKAGLAAAAEHNPSVIVLDLMLPDLLGTEVCRRLRADPEHAQTGILILTARGGEIDRVEGFERGADDYVVKPFSMRELVLRVRALARRANETAAAQSAADGGQRLRWHELEVDPVRHRVEVGGQELQLRPMEFRLLQTFMERPGEVFTRERLLEDLWGLSADVSARTIDTHVRRLRQRLGVCGEAIETVHGFGYRLREA